MDTSTKQPKAVNTTSPNKRMGKRRRAHSPKKVDAEQTANTTDTSTKPATQHGQASNKTSGSSPKKKSPQKHASPVKPASGVDASATHRPSISRAYTSPMKPRSDGQHEIVCVYYAKGRCAYGDTCHFVHEQNSSGGNATIEAQTSFSATDQAVKPRAPSVSREGRICYSCGIPGHLSISCPGVPYASSEAARIQLNGEVSRILAAEAQITLEDEDAFFTSLEHTNSQAFTDHQIYGKLSETTISRLMQHAFAVRQASQEAMKLAYQSGQTSDYEKANSLDELAKEILSTPGLSLDQKTKDCIFDVAPRPSG